MTPTGVYDTNVIVSAILKPGSIPASLVGLAMERSVRLILTPVILEEYREVLKRPKFGFDPSSVETFLHDLEKAAVMVYPTKRVRSALDEPDNRILECAQEAKAHYIVTGNKKHSPFSKFNADFREPLTLLISAHFRALSVPTFGVIVELRCINAGTNKSIHGGS